MPFWVHQGVEYLVGLLLVVSGLQAVRPLGPVLAGTAVLALAATAHGPLGAFKWVPRRVHRLLDLVVAAGLVVLALLLPSDQVDAFGRVLLVIAAMVLVMLVVRTSSTARAKEQAEAPGRSRADDMGRAAGRAVGKGINELKRRSGSGEDASPR